MYVNIYVYMYSCAFFSLFFCWCLWKRRMVANTQFCEFLFKSFLIKGGRICKAHNKREREREN